MPQKDQGSFLTGFSLGLFAGAIGYFLFGTDNGKKVRTDLNKEWNEAKEKLAEEGIIEDPHTSFRDMVSAFFNKILSVSPTTSGKKPVTKKKEILPKATKSSTKKFKGT
jgi:gas vesicle protein